MRVGLDGEVAPLADAFEAVGVPVSVEGIVILGLPIFRSEEWLSQHLARATLDLQSFLAKVELMQPQHALAVIRHCAASRLTHLWRGVPHNLARPHAKNAEDAIWLSACKILGIPLDPSECERLGFKMDRARALCFLPSGIGGFGILSPVAALEPAFLGGWAMALSELGDFDAAAFDWWCSEVMNENPTDEVPSLAQVRRGFRTALAQVGKNVGSARDLTADLPRGIAPDSLAQLPATLTNWVTLLRGREVFKLQKRIGDVVACVTWAKTFRTSSTPIRALLRARTDPHSRNHVGALPGHSLLYLTPTEMIFMARDALCLPFCNEVVTEDWITSNNARRDAAFDPEQESYLRCLRLLRNSHHSPTHTAVGNVLRLMVEGVGVNYRHETQYNERDADGVNRRGDWSENVLQSATVRTRTLYDQTIVDPSAQHVAVEAQLSVGFAASHAEEIKNKQNLGLCEREGWVFCPLAIETTGGFGGGLQKLIKKCKDRSAKYPESVPMCETWTTPNFSTFWSQALRITISKSLLQRWQGIREAVKI